MNYKSVIQDILIDALNRISPSKKADHTFDCLIDFSQSLGVDYMSVVGE